MDFSPSQLNVQPPPRSVPIAVPVQVGYGTQFLGVSVGWALAVCATLSGASSGCPGLQRGQVSTTALPGPVYLCMEAPLPSAWASWTGTGARILSCTHRH